MVPNRPKSDGNSDGRKYNGGGGISAEPNRLRLRAVRVADPNRAARCVTERPMSDAHIPTRAETRRRAAEIVARDIEPDDEDSPTTVYRFYAGDLLLYVGITLEGMHRYHAHVRAASWWQYVTSGHYEHYPQRAEAAIVERVAIENERPLFNRRGKGIREVVGEGPDYVHVSTPTYLDSRDWHRELIAAEERAYEMRPITDQDRIRALERIMRRGLVAE